MEGDFETKDPGTYLIQIVEKAQGKVTASQTAGLTVSYSPEYGMPADGEKELRNWLLAGGGTQISQADEVFGGLLPDKWDTQTVSQWLLMLAALLFPFDVAVRRLQLPDHWWARLAGIWSRKRTVATSATQQAVLTRLGEKRASQRGGAQAVSKEMDSGRDKGTAVSTPNLQSTARATSSKAAATSSQAERATNEQAQPDETLNRLLAAKKRRTK